MQRSQFKGSPLNNLRVNLREKFKDLLLTVLYATGPRASILTYYDSTSQAFFELATYALALSTTRVSNAVVKRIFSHVTMVKSTHLMQVTNSL